MKNCLVSFIIALFSICSIARGYIVSYNTTMDQFANLPIAHVSGHALEILTDGFKVVADLTVYQVAHMLHTRTPYVLKDSVAFLDNNGTILASGSAHIEGDPHGQSIRFTLAQAQADAVSQELYIYDKLEQDISKLIAEAYSTLGAGHGLDKRDKPLNHICGFSLNNSTCQSYEDCSREKSDGRGKRCGCLKTSQAKLCLTYKP